MKRFIPLIMMAVSAFAASAAVRGVTVSASMDSTVLEMGSQSTLTIAVSAPSGLPEGAHIVDFPKVDADYHGVDVISIQADTVAEGANTLTTYSVRVQAFDPGTVEIPPIALAVGEGDTVFSRAVALKVLPVDVDSLETINPMAPTAEHARRWYDWVPDWWIWVALGLFVIVVGGIVAYLLVNRRKIIAAVASKPVPPFEKAIARMEKLRSSKLAESGNEKTYYTELTDILREYLEGRFGINALEMSSTEIDKALRANTETRPSADQIREILRVADFVKFAKERPMPEDNIKTFNEALEFIEKTKPVPQPEEVPEPDKK